MTKLLDATLAEIEEIARQSGAEHVATHRSIVDQYKGLPPEDIGDEMARNNASFFNRHVRLLHEAGAKSSQRKAYARGLHAGMTKGAAALFAPYLNKGTA